MSVSKGKRLPEVLVFAGPNGSGKSSITRMVKVTGTYINADDICRAVSCSELEAAQLAEELRERMIAEHCGFTFETVLSTDRNLKLLRKAKKKEYFIKCVYVLTSSEEINVARVQSRVEKGGHGVPEDNIRSRYHKALALIPELVKVCDIMIIYDNSENPDKIFKKNKTGYSRWENKFWSKEAIEALTGIHEFDE